MSHILSFAWLPVCASPQSWLRFTQKFLTCPFVFFPSLLVSGSHLFLSPRFAFERTSLIKLFRMPSTVFNFLLLNVFGIHSSFFMSVYCWITLHYVDIRVFIHQLIFGLLLVGGFYMLSCYDYSCTNLLVGLGICFCFLRSGIPCT